MKRGVGLLSASLVLVGLAAAPAPASAARPQAAPAAAELQFSPSEVLGLLDDVMGLFSGDSSAEVVAKLDELKAQITQVSTKVTDGFNQLEIDIANSRYASAQEELRPTTTKTNTAYGHLVMMNKPGTTASERAAAKTKFTKACTGITVEPQELLQMYSGDPADGMSQSGLLPAAWEILVAQERSVQQAKAGARPAFYSYRTLRQMRRVGYIAEDRITQYALVKGACDALQFTTRSEQQAAATAVKVAIQDGDADSPGLTAVGKSLPRRTPRLTGVFTGDIAGGKGLIVGNFSPIQQQGAAPISVSSVLSGQGFDGELTMTPSQVALRNDGTITRRFDRPIDPVQCLSWWYSKLSWEPCGGTKQTFEIEGGRIKPTWLQDVCLTATRLDPRYEVPRADLQGCQTGPAAQWWIDGPVPTLDNNAADRLRFARNYGEPLGKDRPAGSQPWSTQWDYFEAEWLTKMRASVVKAGGTMRSLTASYGSNTTVPNLRILPAVTTEPVALSSGPSWFIQTAPDASGKRRVVFKQAGNTLPAVVSPGGAQIAAPNIFGIPADGCTYVYERPMSTGFTCPTRR